MHWVTLLDSLDDDDFDGQLGEDDWVLPRILIEYSIVGGKYTSVMNNLENLKRKIEDWEEVSGGKQPQKFRVQNEKGQWVEYEDEEDYKRKMK